jgi:uncharacterized protein YecE (DUF72 family)
MKCWIGTSGYSYSDWVGGFYPPGTKGQGMLAYYCRQFPVVELNFSFYRTPSPVMLARMADATPASFQFIVKAPRTVSHEERDDELPLFLSAVTELQRRDRLLGVLCQLPQSNHYCVDRLERLAHLAEALAGTGLAVEFRHHSWHRPEIPSWLAERRIDLVSVDVPNLPGLYPRGLKQSTGRIYVRFHSRNAENWYKSDKDRYDYSYADDALGEWIEAIRRRKDSAEQVFLLFNNCHRSQAAENARRMLELLQLMDPDLNVVPPSGGAPEQKLLFE